MEAKMSKSSLMLCEKLTPQEAELLDSNWVFEPKFDGIRATIKDGKLFDRRGADITHKYPEFTGLDNIDVQLDGEVMAASGQFNDVSGRVHLKDTFKITLAAQKNPAQFMAFDVVTHPETLEQRRVILLATVLQQARSWLKCTPQYSADEFKELWRDVLETGAEGLVAKRKGTVYEHRRSSSWKKVKNFIECVAVFTKLEKHTHGVRLETADGKSVNVNGAQAKEVESIFRATGSVKAEIQYMAQLETDSWRFPSFRSIYKG
jgi:ATP-dependent DNA ligase